jgi:lysozyme
MRLTHGVLCEQLEQEEARIPYAYQDSEGKWTIGVGCLIDKNGGGLYDEEIEFIFMNRVHKGIEQVNKQFPWVVALNDPRKAVIYGMRFQMGLGGLLKFKKFLQAAQSTAQGGTLAPADAAREMKDSLWYKQTPKRVERLAKQFETGEWVLQK